jgi:hypothetical protein
MAVGTRYGSPPEPGFARREALHGSLIGAAKKGAHGGNMVSLVSEYPVIFSLGG